MRNVFPGSKGKMPLLWLGLCALFVSGTPLSGQDESPAAHEIRMTVKKYEYEPNQIRVKQGERVRIVLTALDRKHGFQIKEFGIKTDVAKGKETVVEFIVSKAGEFPFQCSVFCGLGHWRVRGMLIVEPAEPR